MFVKHALVLVILLSVAFLADTALAQSFGEVSGAQSFIDWALGPVMLLVVTVALIVAVLIGLWQQSLPAFFITFVVVLIVGGVTSFIPQIASIVVGS